MRHQLDRESCPNANEAAAITKARKDGNSFLVLRLEKGGLVREKFGISCCDPLSLDVDQSSSNGHNRADTAATPDENTNGHR